MASVSACEDSLGNAVYFLSKRPSTPQVFMPWKIQQ